jgi:hypothetical protein
MRNKEYQMKNKIIRMNNIKNCTDCLHCKVSATSPDNSRLCYCDKRKKKEYEAEFYWLNKTVCKNFEDMTA